ncbi:MAG: hypothetical protein ACHP7N_00240 [Caulobacterales bacterium]
MKRSGLCRRAAQPAAYAFLALLAACFQDDGGVRARAVAMKTLSPMSFAQAAEPGRCLKEDCGHQKAGFAFAKRARLTDPDDCYHMGDEDFVEGCRQYGEDIDSLVKKALERR